MFGDCSKLLTREVFGVLRGGIVKVDCPGGSDKSIGEFFFLLDVLLLQYDIAEQSAGFALASDIGDPGKFEFFVFDLITAGVL